LKKIVKNLSCKIRPEKKHESSVKNGIASKWKMSLTWFKHSSKNDIWGENKSCHSCTDFL
jgi:hypothetical protein